MTLPLFRVGLGTDIHHFRADGELVLGGLIIPETPRLEGHSDGDVLLHALCDACLGAAGLADIGVLFPDTDPTLAGIDSRRIAARTVELLTGEGLGIVNLDAVLEGRRPRIDSRRDELRRSVATAFGISPDRINLKGKTQEGVGPEGEGRALRVLAVALLGR